VTSTSVPIETVDVILRDGSTLRLRAPHEYDRQALVRFFEQLSERSLYLRFHGRPTIDERLVDPVVDPDWIDRGALIGTVIESGVERVVALANYVRLRDPLTAEVAFAVADAYQGRGIGTRLVEQLATRAASRGIERFIGEVMADNAAMIKVFEGVGFEVTRTLGGGEVEMTFPIASTVG
jgi:RimJ/RimL family protein N-acetyltransferase